MYIYIYTEATSKSIEYTAHVYTNYHYYTKQKTFIFLILFLNMYSSSYNQSAISLERIKALRYVDEEGRG